MKKLLTLCVAIATTTAGFAQRPLLVGHRGSSYGVENSVESFTNGAKLGYEYIETDFKVTKDKQLVCSHDDDLSRLGGSSMTIAGNTLEDLQKVVFTQTRLGTTYTGRLCSAQEYLDVCKEYNVRPLIELKWATGINSNDCSNIPLLIKFVEDNGFRDKCIIMTSMKPCLEYIRKNYPDIELQFLTGQYWANHFDWCVEQGIDADIQAGYFDKTTVQKYHDAGLKVNMWTTNTAEGYKQYGDWGCDFITTDYLDPKDLPDLDPSVLFPPNTVDYPNVASPVKGFYHVETALEAPSPATLDGRTVKKAILDGNEWVVLSLDQAGAPRIDRFDAVTGAPGSSYSLDGLDAPADIAMSADGILIASASAPFRLFKWSAIDTAPTPLYSNDEIAAGSHIAVSGRLKDLKVYAPATDALVGLWFQNGSLFKNVACAAPVPGDYSLTVSPSSRDCFIIDSPDAVPVEYCFDWTGSAPKVFANFPDGLVANDADGLSFYRRATKVYAVIPSCNTDGSALNATVFDVTDGIAEAAPVTEPLHPEGIDHNPAEYIATALAPIDGKLHALIFTAAHGLDAFLLDADKAAPEPQSVDLELSLDWIHSESTLNKPEHIDGTNAQQGTAVNGLFYINDCVDKQIHIFGQTGYLGAIPGGAGWGCCRDDAGNIIVRDDKLTDTSHSFIIYPAGATPEAPGQAIRLDVEVKADGQTNFINAGGDVLAGTGHIYLFPNKQNAVNIITVTRGTVTASKVVKDLAFAGTTAGYVIPVNDDPENWIYQVRNTGVYFYNGGINTNLSPARTGTTVPARNTTGGAAYFSLLGNNIFVHNSSTNYVGGFTVRNLSAGDSDAAQVVANIAPIGSMGYKTGGNYSTFNWLIPERVADNEYAIYQYCPANGIARYTLRDRLSAVSDIAVDNTEVAWNISADHNTLSVAGINVTDLRIYSVSGVLVAHNASDSVNISKLPAGLYIVSVNNRSARKFFKH